MPLWLFAFFAIIAVVSALGVILQRHPVHCLLALALALLDIGALFIGLGAEALGFLQIIIYVGAIMVLFLFVIWLLNLQREGLATERIGLKVIGTLAAAALGAELCALLVHAGPAPAAPLPVDYGSLRSLARLLFANYLVAFEVTSALLLAAMVGAIGLARRIPGTNAVAAPPSDVADRLRSAAG
ncbi:MAG TPA: NADH-quinone oxidoreductase subunit J [Candidatus Binataceae bacterium]|jgi:NADH-quinone oxidoreductase subunit J|nr:NADH-quinone oxidoreductase subunit J [Candidatus Binataceae bacterium]